MTTEPHALSKLTLLIAEHANRIAQKRCIAPGGELDLWLEAEAEVKRAQGQAVSPRGASASASRVTSARE